MDMYAVGSHLVIVSFADSPAKINLAYAAAASYGFFYPQAALVVVEKKSLCPNDRKRIEESSCRESSWKAFALHSAVNNTMLSSTRTHFIFVSYDETCTADGSSWILDFCQSDADVALSHCTQNVCKFLGLRKSKETQTFLSEWKHATLEKLDHSCHSENDMDSANLPSLQTGCLNVYDVKLFPNVLYTHVPLTAADINRTPRLLVLVIASQGVMYDPYIQAIKNRKHPCVDTYLLYNDLTIDREYIISEENSTVHVSGHERHCYWIVKKTIVALHALLKKYPNRWTHVLRTNISSFFDWHGLLIWLECFHNCRRFLAAISGQHEKYTFASGAGFLMSTDVAAVLASAPLPYFDDPALHRLEDDVTISQYLIFQRCFDGILLMPRFDVSELHQNAEQVRCILNEGNFHIRCWANREAQLLFHNVCYPKAWSHVIIEQERFSTPHEKNNDIWRHSGSEVIWKPPQMSINDCLTWSTLHIDSRVLIARSNYDIHPDDLPLPPARGVLYVGKNERADAICLGGDIVSMHGVARANDMLATCGTYRFTDFRTHYSRSIIAFDVRILDEYISGETLLCECKAWYKPSAYDQSINLSEMNGNAVFCKTESAVYEFFDYMRQNTQLSCKLVTHNSDIAIDKDMADRKPQNITRWFACNSVYEHPDVVPIPIGLANGYCQVTAKMALIKQVDTFAPRTKLLYINHNVRTYASERQPLLDMFIRRASAGENWFTISTGCELQQYLSQLVQHKFVACPRGNGVDTHRLWEALYTRTIPIVRYDAHYRHFTDLPIVFVESWHEVNEEFLTRKFFELQGGSWNYEKLSVKWWRNLFEA